MRAALQLPVASFAALLLAGAVAAQAREVPAVVKRARALVNQLELAERRAAAADELLALGIAAVPALAARLDDPRTEVVQVVCEVLCALGPTAEAVLPQLVTAAGSSNAAIVRMVRLTELRVRVTGATTICACEPHRVVRIAADGTEQELLKGEMQYDAEPLPDDHLLVTQWSKGRVAEYDGKGKEVWSYTECKTPIRASRLLGGNTLIADVGAKRAVEVDAKGAVVWEWKSTDPKGHIYDADRLANGRTLVTLYPAQVVEVDRAGEVVWQIDELEGVFEADRLPNGNTLLCLYRGGVVREVNPKGETVWEIVDVKGPRDANRLANGNTLVGAEAGAFEFGPDGKQLAQFGSGKVIFEVVRH